MVNETAPTTTAGPYTVQLYTDNPTVTLRAEQAGTVSSYSYNWLAACNTPPQPPTPTAPTAPTLPNQTAAQGTPFSYVVPAFSGTAPITYSASGLPGGLSFDAPSRTISGTPTTVQSSLVTINATNSAGMATGTFTITVNAAPVNNGPFAITGVNTLSCQPVSAGSRQLTFTPLYSGTTGQPISFAVVNETAPTTTAGPYTVQLYTDNPTVTLRAEQAGTVSSYSYNWLAACNTPPQPPTPTAPTAPTLPNQTATQATPFSYVVPAFSGTAPITYSASGLPAGLSFDAPSRTISGTPTTVQSSLVTINATNSAGMATGTFTITVNAAPVNNGPFAITGVNTLNCQPVSAGSRQLTFTPLYSGTTGQPISFAVVNETAPSTVAGPYTVQLYTDNPTVTLRAEQAGTVSSYSYNWLAVCNAPARLATPEQYETLTVTVLNNPVTTDALEVLVRGAGTQRLHLELLDSRGRLLGDTRVEQAQPAERISLSMERTPGLYLLRVSTPTQQQVVKLLRQ
ncbi:hypothetical protein GCM10027578_08890 [Spirosoma luteolum]